MRSLEVDGPSRLWAMANASVATTRNPPHSMWKIGQDSERDEQAEAAVTTKIAARYQEAHHGSS